MRSNERSGCDHGGYRRYFNCARNVCGRNYIHIPHERVHLVVDKRGDALEERCSEAARRERAERMEENRETKRALGQGLKDIRNEVGRAINAFGQLVRALSK